MIRRTLLVLLLLLATVVRFITGCSESSDVAVTPTTLEAPTSPTAAPVTTAQPVPVAAPQSTTAPASTAASQDAAVLTAVRSFWDMFIEVGGRAAPFDPQLVRGRLAERTTGVQTTTLFQFFQGNAVSGYVVRGEIELAPKVIANDGTTAQVRDCHDDRTGIYRAADGTRIDTDNPARHQVLMTLRLESGTWKVASIVDEGDGCVAS